MKTRIVTALAVAAFSFACQRETAPVSTAKGAGETTTHTVVATEDASTAAVDVKIPITANSVARCEPSKTAFKRNEPIALTLDLNEVPEALQVAARVLDEDGGLVARVMEPANGRKSMTLTIDDDIPAGRYRLEGLWGGNIACEHSIEIGR